MQNIVIGSVDNLLFEDPLPVGLSLIVVAAVLGFLAFQRNSAKLKKVAAGAFVLSVLIFVIASLITTSREQVIARTRELVSHTAPLRMSEFKSLVSPQVTVTIGEDAGAPVFTGAEVFTKLDNALRNHPIDAQTVIEITAQSRTHQVVECRFDVRSDGKGGRVMTRWILTWRQQLDGTWLATQVQWIDCPHLIGIKPSAGWLR